MRSWALRILAPATICMALVIFCVLLMLAILVRISLAPAMSLSSHRPVRRPGYPDWQGGRNTD